ncbi:MAG: hypothetical protein A4E25_00141 [Methanobacterium sp. PtaB.Bin024]|nr:MAG: hypothetical protein A4E25_00141 [Methanobacterium sp. PtaB.Bin024]
MTFTSFGVYFSITSWLFPWAWTTINVPSRLAVIMSSIRPSRSVTIISGSISSSRRAVVAPSAAMRVNSSRLIPFKIVRLGFKEGPAPKTMTLSLILMSCGVKAPISSIMLFNVSAERSSSSRTKPKSSRMCWYHCIQRVSSIYKVYPIIYIIILWRKFFNWS